jgi:type III secretion protein J
MNLVRNIRKKSFLSLFFVMLASALFFLTSCENNMVILTDVNEREANEIVVFLATRGISAQKIVATSSSPAAAITESMYSIAVSSSDSTEAMSILNQNGLPRKKGTNLLELFAKQGLMSSEKEETIRYQAGLAMQIANMIRKIDGVIDADVQLSFPEAQTALPGTQTAIPQKVTAAVYVKHQGILDDPNSHLVTKIKRLVAGSVNGLDINDVTVISDRSRFTDMTLNQVPNALSPQGKEKEYVSIWSIVMSKSSAPRFRALFFTLTVISILFALIIGWLLWKFYPILRRQGGVRQLLTVKPFENASGTEIGAETSPEDRV